MKGQPDIQEQQPQVDDSLEALQQRLAALEALVATLQSEQVNAFADAGGMQASGDYPSLPRHVPSGRHYPGPASGFRCTKNTTTPTTLDVGEGYGKFAGVWSADLSGTITGFSVDGTAWAYVELDLNAGTWSLNRLNGTTKPTGSTTSNAETSVWILAKITVASNVISTIKQWQYNYYVEESGI